MNFNYGKKENITMSPVTVKTLIDKFGGDIESFIRINDCRCGDSCTLALNWLLSVLVMKIRTVTKIEYEKVWKTMEVNTHFTRFDFLVDVELNIDYDQLGISFTDTNNILIMTSTPYGNCIIYNTKDPKENELIFQIALPKKVGQLFGINSVEVLNINKLRLIIGDTMNIEYPVGYRLNKILED